MPPFYVAIIILVVIVVSIVYGIYSSISSTLNYYKSLGARVVGYRFLSPVATLGEVLLYTDYKRGGNSLIVELPIKASGYIKLRKRDFLDKLLFQKSYKGLSVEYDDELWANKLFSLKEFVELVDRLFEEHKIDWFELKGNRLRIGRYIKREPTDRDEKRLLSAAETVKKFKPFLNSLPKSQNYREDLRKWLSFKLPVALTLFLSLVGILGGFSKYSPTCMPSMLLTSSKLLFPMIVFYAGFSSWFAGGPAMWQKMFLKTLLVSLVCYFPITIFFLTYINGSLDLSDPELKRDFVEEKYKTRRKVSYILVLANYHKEKPCCGTFAVSKDLYEKVSVGSTIEYQTKRGFLGVEWFYTGLSTID